MGKNPQIWPEFLYAAVFLEKGIPLTSIKGAFCKKRLLQNYCKLQFSVEDALAIWTWASFGMKEHLSQFNSPRLIAT